MLMTVFCTKSYDPCVISILFERGSSIFYLKQLLPGASEELPESMKNSGIPYL